MKIASSELALKTNGLNIQPDKKRGHTLQLGTQHRPTLRKAYTEQKSKERETNSLQEQNCNGRGDPHQALFQIAN